MALSDRCEHKLLDPPKSWLMKWYLFLWRGTSRYSFNTCDKLSAIVARITRTSDTSTMAYQMIDGLITALVFVKETFTLRTLHNHNALRPKSTYLKHHYSCPLGDKYWLEQISLHPFPSFLIISLLHNLYQSLPIELLFFCRNRLHPDHRTLYSK